MSSDFLAISGYARPALIMGKQAGKGVLYLDYNKCQLDIKASKKLPAAAPVALTYSASGASASSSSTAASTSQVVLRLIASQRSTPTPPLTGSAFSTFSTSATPPHSAPAFSSYPSFTPPHSASSASAAASAASQGSTSSSTSSSSSSVQTVALSVLSGSTIPQSAAASAASSQLQLEDLLEPRVDLNQALEKMLLEPRPPTPPTS